MAGRLVVGQSGHQVDDWIGSMPCCEGAGAWAPGLPSPTPDRAGAGAGTRSPSGEWHLQCSPAATFMGEVTTAHPWRIDAGCSTVQVKLRCSSFARFFSCPGPGPATYLCWPVIDDDADRSPLPKDCLNLVSSTETEDAF